MTTPTTAIQLKVNGDSVSVDAGMTLEKLLKFYRLKTEMVVVELNRTVPAKEAYATLVLQDGDALEIVKFLGGG